MLGVQEDTSELTFFEEEGNRHRGLKGVDGTINRKETLGGIQANENLLLVVRLVYRENNCTEKEARGA